MLSGVRRSPRFPFYASAEITDVQTRTRFDTRTSELSRHGCYLDTINPLPRGTALQIQLLHHEQRVAASGHVVHSQPNMGMGVAFDEVEPTKLQALEKWLADLGESS